AGGRQLCDGRGACPADDEVRIGELGRHVLNVSEQLGRNAELEILRAYALDIVGAGLLDDLQPAAERWIEQAQAGWDDLAKNGRALASASDQDLQWRGLVKRGKRQFAQAPDLFPDRVSDQYSLVRDFRFQPVDPFVGRCDRVGFAR